MKLMGGQVRPKMVVLQDVTSDIFSIGVLTSLHPLWNVVFCAFAFFEVYSMDTTQKRCASIIILHKRADKANEEIAHNCNNLKKFYFSFFRFFFLFFGVRFERFVQYCRQTRRCLQLVVFYYFPLSGLGKIFISLRPLSSLNLVLFLHSLQSHPASHFCTFSPDGLSRLMRVNPDRIIILSTFKVFLNSSWLILCLLVMPSFVIFCSSVVRLFIFLKIFIHILCLFFTGSRDQKTQKKLTVCGRVLLFSQTNSPNAILWSIFTFLRFLPLFSGPKFAMHSIRLSAEALLGCADLRCPFINKPGNIEFVGFYQWKIKRVERKWNCAIGKQTKKH